MTARNIVSLALIKVMWDDRKFDYIENFVPFIATLIIKNNYGTIDTTKICIDFENEFGLRIPYHPMCTILNRAKKRDLITKQYNKFIPNKDRAIEYDFSDISKEQQGAFKNLIEKFINFCNDNYNIKLDEEEAEKAIVYFLKNQDMEILFASQEKSLLPDVKSRKRNVFLFSKFTQYVYKNDPTIFKLLTNIAIGHILANAILFGYDLSQHFISKIKNLNIYLDTKLIFQLLGSEGPERQSICKEFLNQLKEQRTNIFVFQHTYDEMIRIVNNCYDFVEASDYDPSKASRTLQYFVESGYKQSDVLMFIEKIEDTLNGYNIRIIETPDPNIDSIYQIDEDKLRKTIIAKYKERIINFEEMEKDYTIQKDIQSIAAVNKLRKGRLPVNIKNVGHIFITTNVNLAHASRIFEIEVYGENFKIPACMTDIFISTLIWLQSPARVDRLNEKKVIADCYAALHPDSILIKKFINQVEKLKQNNNITDDDYYVLRTSVVARELLVEKTMGEIENLREFTAQEIIDDIKKDAEKKYVGEKAEHAKTTDQLGTITSKMESIEESISNKADKIASIISKIIFWLSLILICVFIALQFLSTKWVAIVLAILFFVFDIFYGFNIINLKERTKERIKNKITKWIKGK